MATTKPSSENQAQRSDQGATAAGRVPADAGMQERAIDASEPTLFAALSAALAAEGLPIDDLSDAGRAFYAYFCADGSLAGFAGFEHHGEHVLLRSVVVLPGHRGRGLVRQIVPMVLERAFALGAHTAWLLTESAEKVFLKLGFDHNDRATAPEAIRSTVQFQTLCGEHAVLMKRLIRSH